MPFNISTFQGTLLYGGARQNQFDVLLPFPAGIGIQTPLSGDFTFKCRAASLPPEELGTIIVPYFGRQLKFAGDRTFPEWTVTVINDEDWAQRAAFETWSGAINSHVGNLRNTAANAVSNGISAYQADAAITQYGKTGNTIATYTMVGMWPSNVSMIETAWDSNDAIEVFQVTFQYQWWESATTDHSGSVVTSS